MRNADISDIILVEIYQIMYTLVDNKKLQYGKAIKTNQRDPYHMLRFTTWLNVDISRVILIRLIICTIWRNLGAE